TAANFLEDARNCGARLVKNVEIIAEDSYNHVGSLAREGLLDAFGKERIESEVITGKAGKNSANSILDFIGLLTLTRLYSNIDLAFVGSYGILAQFRPAGALGDTF